MSTTRKPSYAASSNLTITLASLATSSTLVVGRVSTQVDNSSNLYLDYLLSAKISTGTSLTVAMQNSEVFPNMVLQMVAIGEESGALDSMLGKVADFYEEEVDAATADMSKIIEPLLMVMIAIFVGIFAIAMITPMYTVLNNI